MAAGNLRQQLGDDPSWTEARLVLRSVNDINLPKFTVEDLPLFKGITSDLFPGVELGESDHGPLLQSIDAVCEEGITISPGQELKLEPKQSWKKKVIQLYEMVLVRHGVMIVGQTGSGKTTTVHALASAMSRCCDGGSANLARVQVYSCRLIFPGRFQTMCVRFVEYNWQNNSLTASFSDLGAHHEPQVNFKWTAVRKFR